MLLHPASRDARGWKKSSSCVCLTTLLHSLALFPSPRSPSSMLVRECFECTSSDLENSEEKNPNRRVWCVGCWQENCGHVRDRCHTHKIYSCRHPCRGMFAVAFPASFRGAHRRSSSQHLPRWLWIAWLSFCLPAPPAARQCESAASLARAT